MNRCSPRLLRLIFATGIATLLIPGHAGPAAQSGQSVLIRGGTVFDGTAAAGRPAALRIRGGVIVDIAPTLEPGSGERVIDVAGLAVAPGFIDMHSHADRGLSAHPDAESQVRQGITTAIVGQDGGSALPIADFFGTIERAHPSINYASAVGHGTVRGIVLGGDFKRPATPREIETMRALVDRAMRDGAIGLSSGLEYDPGFYARPEELVALAKIVAGYGGIYSSHVRDEENDVFDAWREAIDVGRQAGVPVEISHLKLASKPVWGRANEALHLLEQASREGVRVMADWYPYAYWQSSLYVLIPDREFENRDKWSKGLDEIGGAGNVLVTDYPPDPAYNGRTLAEIAGARKTDAVSLIIDMIRTAGPNIGIIGTAMIEPDLEAFFAHPQVLICSDGGLAGRHPRGYGAFPRVLGRYVRERRLVTLAEAIAKMTGRAAAQTGLTDRGVLAPGRAADIVVFDPSVVTDRGTPQDPARSPEGIRFVIVNGEVVLENGVLTRARPGRALRATR